MKKFIIENWYKIIISLCLIALLVLAVLFYGKYNKGREKVLPQSVTEKVLQSKKEESSEKKVIDTKSDEYIVTYDKKGNLVSWETVDFAISAMLNDTLEAYASSLLTIQEAQNKEKDTVISAYGALANTTDSQSRAQLQTLISYEEAFITSGDNLIGLLSDLVKNYRGLINAAQKRDAPLYRYFSKQIDPLEARKSGILGDYADKQVAKQNYAKSMLAQ